jgi:hypothetical protein
MEKVGTVLLKNVINFFELKTYYVRGCYVAYF